MADDRHVRRDGDDYAAALAALLPSGIGWRRDPDTVLMKTVAGLAGFWGFVDGRAADLLERESDPRLTLELLPDWERNWGLPDPCVTEPLTIEERRALLVQRMTILGDASRQFFYDIATQLGYTINIVERLPWQFGISWVGDTRSPTVNGGWPTWEIGPPELRYSWFIQVLNTRLVWWMFGSAEIGVNHHLEFSEASDLQCLIHRWKPAQTTLLFDYSRVTLGPDMPDTLRVHEAPDTMAVFGYIPASGPLAAVETKDMVSMPGIGITPTGWMAATEAKDVLVIWNIPGSAGTLISTEAVDAAVLAGDVGFDSLMDQTTDPLLDETGATIYGF